MPIRRMEVFRIDPSHGAWPAYVEHLRRTDQARWVLDGDRLTGAFLFLAASVDGAVVADLALREQSIVVPATEGSGGERTLTSSDATPLRETYVQTFHVEAPYRRGGLGRALQTAALEWTRATP